MLMYRATIDDNWVDSITVTKVAPKYDEYGDYEGEREDQKTAMAINVPADKCGALSMVLRSDGRRVIEFIVGNQSNGSAPESVSILLTNGIPILDALDGILTQIG